MRLISGWGALVRIANVENRETQRDTERDTDRQTERERERERDRIRIRNRNRNRDSDKDRGRGRCRGRERERGVYRERNGIATIGARRQGFKYKNARRTRWRQT